MRIERTDEDTLLLVCDEKDERLILDNIVESLMEHADEAICEHVNEGH